MEKINGFTQQNVDWKALAEKINQPTALGEIGKSSLQLDKDALSVSSEGARVRSGEISVPEMEAPAVADQGDLDTFVAKLNAGDTFQYSEETLKAMGDKLSASFAEALGDIGGLSLGKGALFDVYQLVALMLTVAQKQRDAAREIRLAENEAIQNAIMHQAEMQRSAAMAGMIAGVVVCAMQVTAQGIAVAKAGSAYHRQAQVAGETGVTGAQADLKAANLEKAEALTQSNELTKIEKEMTSMLKEDPNYTKQLDAFKAKYNLQGEDLAAVRQEVNTRVDTAKENVLTKEANLSTAEARMTSHSEFLKAGHLQTKWRSLSDIFGAVGMSLQGLVRGATDLMSAKATEEGAVRQEAEEQLDQIKDLFSQGQEVVNKVVQLMAAVIQAETQSMRDAIHA